MNNAIFHDLEAEKAVLAALVSKPAKIPEIVSSLKVTDFTTAWNRKIYKAVHTLFMDGGVVDLVSVLDSVRLSGNLEKEDPTRIAKLTSGSLIPGGRTHVEIVKRFSKTRKLQQGFRDGLNALQAGAHVDEVIGDFSAHLDDHEGATGKSTSISDSIDIALEKIKERATHGGGLAGISTGYEDLDQITGGLVASNLVILAARPAMGKSTLALNISENVARSGRTVAFFSLEMSANELLEKLISRVARVPLSRIRNGSFSTDEHAKIEKASEDLKSLPFHLFDRPALTIQQLTASVKGLVMRHGLGLIVVDYLQLMRGEGQTREREIAGISRALKALAMELHVPIVALSQLNRGVESRTDKRPLLSDLRDSGSIEQDSNTVIFIYRHEAYETEETNPSKGIAELIISKNRAGTTGTVRLSSSRLSYSEFTMLPHLTGSR